MSDAELKEKNKTTFRKNYSRTKNYKSSKALKANGEVVAMTETV